MKEPGQTILLIEDNEDDVFVMERALEQAQITNPLAVVSDGQQALDYVSGTGKYALAGGTTHVLIANFSCRG
jgi:CheY-like chemotaxis protein